MFHRVPLLPFPPSPLCSCPPTPLPVHSLTTLFFSFTASHSYDLLLYLSVFFFLLSLSLCFFCLFLLLVSFFFYIFFYPNSFSSIFLSIIFFYLCFIVSSISVVFHLSFFLVFFFIYHFLLSLFFFFTASHSHDPLLHHRFYTPFLSLLVAIISHSTYNGSHSILLVFTPLRHYRHLFSLQLQSFSSAFFFFFFQCIKIIPLTLIFNHSCLSCPEVVPCLIEALGTL